MQTEFTNAKFAACATSTARGRSSATLAARTTTSTLLRSFASTATGGNSNCRRTSSSTWVRTLTWSSQNSRVAKLAGNLSLVWSSSKITLRKSTDLSLKCCFEVCSTNFLFEIIMKKNIDEILLGFWIYILDLETK